VTYLDHPPLARVRSEQLYRERYVLITRAEGAFARPEQRSATWAEAGSLPLCLLTPDMQNRRIIDMYFHKVGIETRAVVETNSLITLWSHICFGPWSTVVPHTFLLLLRPLEGMVALPLIDPDASHLLGLVASDRDPLPPLTRSLLAVAGQVDLSARIEAHIARAWSVPSA
jgi:DNA-binding transcriptional LysR family regulator